MQVFTINKEEELEKVAKEIIKNKEKIYLLKGDLGAGKTALVKKLMHQLDSKDMVTSPTFSILNSYKYPKGKAFHFDLYRLETIEEILDIGIEEYLDSGEYCFIEWADIIKPYIQEPYKEIDIQVTNQSRQIKIQ